MKADSRLASSLEGALNTAVGFTISVISGYFIYPLFGWNASVTEVTGLTAIFTAISFLRTYGCRRLFILLGRQGWLK